MKKSKKLLLGLLAASVGLLAVFLVAARLTGDRQPPEISCPQEPLNLSVQAAEADLLVGVTARDDRDGDLSGRVVVESISSIGKDHTRQVVYAVMDESGNVGRASRTIHYTDYQPPRIHLTSALRADDVSAAYEMLHHIQVSSPLDGDLSASLKYSFVNGTPINGKGRFPIELSVNDSVGRSSVIPTEFEIYDSHQETVQVQLKQYIVYLPVNAPFDPEAYYLSASRSGRMSCTSNVDTSRPGVYHVNYLVETKSSDEYGKSTLIVVVEE